MKEGIKDRGMTGESLLTDVGMSYLSALTPKIGVDAAGNIKVTGGELARDLKDPKFKKKGFLQKLFGGDTTEMPNVKLGMLGREAGEEAVTGIADVPTDISDYTMDTRLGTPKPPTELDVTYENPDMGVSNTTGLAEDWRGYNPQNIPLSDVSEEIPI